MSSKYFYRDRILWKTEKHSLLDEQCMLYSDLPAEDRATVEKHLTVVDDVDPVLVFWSDSDLWTVLGTKKVCSYHDEHLVSEEVDKIGKQVKLHGESGSTPQERKLRSSFALVGKQEKKIWAPSGPKLFALMNILLMFPLGGGINDA